MRKVKVSEWELVKGWGGTVFPVESATWVDITETL